MRNIKILIVEDEEALAVYSTNFPYLITTIERFRDNCDKHCDSYTELPNEENAHAFATAMEQLAKRHKAYKRSGFMTFYVVTVLQKIASICNRLHCITACREGNVVQIVQMILVKSFSSFPPHLS